MYGTIIENFDPNQEEDTEQLDRFELRIAEGEKIEPGDWMPKEYRRQLIRMISQHANSEVVGMLPEGTFITRAPTLRRKIILIAKIQDEGGHGQYLYHAAETLGATREKMLDDLLTGKAKYSNIFNYPTLSWADMGTIGWLVDGAAIMNQTMLARCSYGPYARAMIRICMEENFHKKQGQEMVILYSQGTEEQRAMVQDSINRFWWPSLMMFGPHDKNSPNTPTLVKWGIKTRLNDELRQEFINQMVPDLQALGITIPDKDLKLNSGTGDWDIGPIDWDEFWRVVKGDGPMNKERIGARQKAHDDGAWVRDAMVAYAEQIEIKAH